MTPHRHGVVWPRSARKVELAPLAPRLKTLEGKRLAFAWDYIFQGDEVWEILKAELAARYAGISFVDWQEFGDTHGPREGEILAGIGDKLKKLGVDGFLSGMGC